MDKQTEKILKEENFTIVNLISLFKKRLVILFAVMSFFMLCGVIYYFTTPKSYATMAVLLVESQDNAAGGLSSLAAVAGFGTGGVATESSALDPSLYPIIIQSKPFLEELGNTKISSRIYPDSVTLFKYIVENMPGNRIMRVIKKPSLLFADPAFIDDKEHLSKIGQERRKYNSIELLGLFKLGELIAINNEGQILTMIVNMPEPTVAYQFSKIVQNLLIEYSTRYLQDKQRNQVEYLEVQYEKSETTFREAQVALTNFRERNQGMYLESQKAIERNLNSDYNLKFDLYRTLSQELERARIELNSQKPIFTLIEPPVIPNRPASPRVLITVAFSFALGFVFGLLAIFMYYLRAYFLLKSST